jgi:hypothetical protein
VSSQVPGALQALSQNLLSPGGSIGGAPGTSAAVVPDSAADAIAAEIAHQGLPMDVDPQASQVCMQRTQLPNVPLFGHSGGNLAELLP